MPFESVIHHKYLFRKCGGVTLNVKVAVIKATEDTNEHDILLSVCYHVCLIGTIKAFFSTWSEERKSNKSEDLKAEV